MQESSPDPANCSYDEFNRLFSAHGGTDSNYLKAHFSRFQNTFKRVSAANVFSADNVVVDIGAHWLHQALFYALAGCPVEAFNLPTTFKKEKVRRLAAAYGINLTVAEDLQTGECFGALAESSVDIVLFTEIIEHLTFNPVQLFRAIYRVLKPGGRIVVTTPNYYSLTGRAWDTRRFRSGYGGGLSVHQILNKKTYSHHWKEFSMKELRQYFEILSPDFNCVKYEYTDDHAVEIEAGPVTRFLQCRVPILKPNLHMEVELTKKEHGITVVPGW